MNNISFTAVVLMGGKSSRMGADKALLKRESVSMMEFTKQQLLKAGAGNVLFSVNEKNSGWPDAIQDNFSDLGPLSGIYSVLTQTLNKIETQNYLFVPVDLPFLDANELIELAKLGTSQNKLCHVESHPLPLFIPATTEMLDVLKQALIHKKSLSVHSFIKQFDSVTLPIKNKLQWFNSNTPQQWQQAMGTLYPDL